VRTGKLKPTPAAGRTENQPEAPPGIAVPRQAQTHPITTFFTAIPCLVLGRPWVAGFEAPADNELTNARVVHKEINRTKGAMSMSSEQFIQMCCEVAPHTARQG
jgi:hypothetical protein